MSDTKSPTTITVGPAIVTATARELRVLPQQAADLSFAVDGIVGELNVSLGAAVVAFDFLNFYDGLSATVTAPAADPSALKYTSQAIHDDPNVAKSLLMSLRAGSSKAVLDSAIKARQNSYWQKYSYAAAYAAQQLSTTLQKAKNITALTSTLTNQAGQLTTAYNSANIGVVTGTSSSVTTTDATGKTSGGETIASTNSNYRVPLSEMQAAQYRASISLGDQMFAVWTAQQWIPQQGGILQNELANIDLGVKRLQLSYMDTLLMSPISGMVTAVRKRLGEYVKAGEPVLRVESEAGVFLVGTVVFPSIFPSPPFLKPTATITTTLPGAGGAITVTGTIVSVRGRRMDNGQWDVILRCDTTDGAASPLPLNFSLDPTTTSVAVTIYPP